MAEPILVLLTGGLATGKSTVEKIFEQEGFTVLDTDKVVYGLYYQEDVIIELEKEFGENIITDCVVDREFIKTHILPNPDMVRRLEAVIHPRVYEWCIDWSNKRVEENRCISVPLLFETSNNSLFVYAIGPDAIVTVSVDSIETQLERAVKRGGMSFITAYRLILRQIPNSFKVQLSDYVIDNNSTENSLRMNVKNTIRKIRSDMGDCFDY